MTATDRKQDRATRRAEAMRWAGARAARFSRRTGTLIVLLDVENGGEWLADPSEGGRFVLMCDDHSTLVQFEASRVALYNMTSPDWCPDCQALMAKGERAAGTRAPKRERVEIEDDALIASIRDSLRDA